MWLYDSELQQHLLSLYLCTMLLWKCTMRLWPPISCKHCLVFTWLTTVWIGLLSTSILLWRLSSGYTSTFLQWYRIYRHQLVASYSRCCPNRLFSFIPIYHSYRSSSWINNGLWPTIYLCDKHHQWCQLRCTSVCSDTVDSADGIFFDCQW